jgi:hypothetical protein
MKITSLFGPTGLIIAAFSAFFLISCTSDDANCAEKTSCVNAKKSYEGSNWTAYGEAFEATDVLGFSSIEEHFDSTGIAAGKFEVTIVESCAKMGCWMNVEAPAGGEAIRVFMKDHDFFVPKEGLGGKTAVVDGYAYYDTISVAMQQHYLHDANAEQSEIDAITEPSFELSFEAAGVQIFDVDVDAEVTDVDAPVPAECDKAH